MNVFAGKSKAWLEEQLALAQAEYAAGKTVVSVGGGELSSGKVIVTSIVARIEALYIALNALDSVNYPLSVIARRTRTKAVFS